MVKSELFHATVNPRYMNTLQEFFYDVVFSTYLGSNAAEKQV